MRIDERSVYRAPALDQFGWVEHGFGTRRSADWVAGRRVATVCQIHSSVIVQAQAGMGEAATCLGEGDGLITDQPGLLLAIRTADCLPILIADQRRRVVAAVHAGWRGTAAGVTREAVEGLGREFNSDPGDLVAVIGPGIGACCYQVGPDVEAVLGPFCAGGNADLAEANLRQLQDAGVPADRIFRAGLCTFCGTGDFHSWRRDRGPGRMVSAIGIRA